MKRLTQREHAEVIATTAISVAVIWGVVGVVYHFYPTIPIWYFVLAVLLAIPLGACAAAIGLASLYFVVIVLLAQQPKSVVPKRSGSRQDFRRSLAESRNSWRVPLRKCRRIWNYGMAIAKCLAPINAMRFSLRTLLLVLLVAPPLLAVACAGAKTAYDSLNRNVAQPRVIVLDFSTSCCMSVKDPYP